MLGVGLILRNGCDSMLTVAKRFKVKQKWSAYRRPEDNSDRALKYFDSYYGSVYGEQWPSMRLAMLCRKQHCAMVNRFSSESEKTVRNLASSGAFYLPGKPGGRLSLFYKTSSDTSNDEQQDEIFVERNTADDAGVIMPELSPKNEGLDLFIPPPPISTPAEERELQEQRLFVDNSTESSVKIEQVKNLDFFPKKLKAFAYPATENYRFPQPKLDENELYSYYLLDMASIFTAIALQPQDGHRVLDMCSAPGGKSLAILQLCTPSILHCVDKSPSRSQRLATVLQSYVPDSYLESCVEIFGGCTAESYADRHQASYHGTRSDQMPGFDRVLVDAPCLSDRHSVLDDENNWFKPSRNKERLKLPDAQRDILVAALRCCATDGIVVYSTCTLAPGQNDGVVFAALEMAKDMFNIDAVVEDLSPIVEFMSERNLLYIDPSWSRYGFTVAPKLTANYGPSYCSRIRRLS